MIDYLIHLSILIAIYSILAIALNPVIVSLGSMNIANAALFGIGAYASAFLSLHITTELFVILLFASGLSAVFAAGLGWVSYLLRDDEFAVFTLLTQLVFVVVLSNMDWLGANRGLLNLPPFEIGGYLIDTKLEFLLVAMSLLLIWILTNLVIFGTRRRTLAVAASEDQLLLESMGWSALRLRFHIFSLSGWGAGLAGVLYAHYFTFLEPQIFSLNESFFVILTVSVLGRHGFFSPVIGAFGMIAFPEFLRFLGLRFTHSGPIIQIAFACLLFVVMMYRSQIRSNVITISGSEK